MSNQRPLDLATWEFEKRKVHSPFIVNVWEAGLADMQSISKCNKFFRAFLFVIDIFSKRVWVIPSKVKKGITITNPFQKNLRWT